MKFLTPALVYGEIATNMVASDLSAGTPGAAQTWASSLGFPGPGAPGATPPVRGPRIVTVNTPVGMPADNQCGRAALLDLHITKDPAAAPANPAAGFPAACGPNLTKGEEALAFLFFDLSACIQDDTTPVFPPIVVP